MEHFLKKDSISSYEKISNEQSKMEIKKIQHHKE